MDRKIESVFFNESRISGILKRYGYEYIEDLLDTDRMSLYMLPGMGRKSVMIVKDILEVEFGLELPAWHLSYEEYMDSLAVEAIDVKA